MYTLLVALSVFGAMASSAAAQAGSAAGNQTITQPQAPAGVTPKTVKKVVCERVEDDETGSRTATRKKCRTIEVPAPVGVDAQNGTRTPS